MLRPSAKKAFRLEVAAFCRTAETCEKVWHYTQRRPYTGLFVSPVREHEDDCSAYVALVFAYAARAIGKGVADPLGEHYSGAGNTETAYSFLRSHHAPKDKYRVGDIAIYGRLGDLSSQHMTVCRQAGTEKTSVWSSFGEESGPEKRPLVTGRPIIGVFRHPALL